MTVIPQEVSGNPLALAEFINRMSVSQLFMPSSVLKLFKPVGHSLRMVTTDSERVSDVASCDYAIYNLYGMSEICAAVTAFPIDKPYANTPIGRAMERCVVYLLDENGNIICVNRRDWMMKINGQRVEPGETEGSSSKSPRLQMPPSRALPMRTITVTSVLIM